MKSNALKICIASDILTPYPLGGTLPHFIFFALAVHSMFLAVCWKGVLKLLDGIGRRTRFRAWGRLVRASRQRLTPAERYTRFQATCIQWGAGGLAFAYWLPFPVASAAFWCFLSVFVLVVGLLLFTDHERIRKLTRAG